jgi:putative ABC transport system ATP-binding protein
VKELVILENIEKRYDGPGAGVVALKKINLVINEGEFVAIMGPSGSGKSTLLSILGAINPPTSGRMIVDGIDIYSLKPERQADFRREFIGFVFQQLHLIPYLTAVENVMLPLVISQIDSSKFEVARAALEKVGLGDKLERLPNQLSGGEQGRVAIARAIVNEPPILLADEPTGTLDTKTGQEILRIFQALNQEGHTIVMVTHSQEGAEYAQRLISIRDGEIINDKRKG